MFKLTLEDDSPNATIPKVSIPAALVFTTWYGEDGRIKSLASFAAETDIELTWDRVAVLFYSSAVAILRSFKEDVTQEDLETLMHLSAAYAKANGVIDSPERLNRK